MTIDFLLSHEPFSICLVKLDMWRHNFKMIETTIEKSIKKTVKTLVNDDFSFFFF